MKKTLFLLMLAILPVSAHAEDYRITQEGDTTIIDDLRSYDELREAGVPDEEMRSCIVNITNNSKFKKAIFYGKWRINLGLAPREEIKKGRSLCYRRRCLTKSRVDLTYFYYPDIPSRHDERVDRSLMSNADSHTVCARGRQYQFKTRGKNSIKLVKGSR